MMEEIDAKAKAKGLNKSEYLIDLIKIDTVKDDKGLREEFAKFNKRWLSFKKQYEFSKGLIINNHAKLRKEVERLSAIIDKLKEVDEEVDNAGQGN